MRILQITPGAGDGTDCENCLRDHSLVWALGQAGHDVELIVLYLPPRADRPEEQRDAPVFYGGVNVYLQQVSSIFRKTPGLVDRILDWRPLLRWASRRAGMTRPEDLGPTTLSMLEGEEGRQAKELERLVAHVTTLPPFDVVVLSNALLAGLGPALREALGVPVVCLLQDEDDFLDGLGEWAEPAWQMVGDRLRLLDGQLAVSAYYGDRMRARCGLEDVAVVHAGIHGADAPERTGEALTFCATLRPQDGADLMLEAWEGLEPRPELVLAGIKKFDEDYIASWQGRLEGQPSRLVRSPDRAARQQLLAASALMVSPTRKGEAFGRHVLEAMACGVPVVLPEHGSFPELIAATGGGVLVPPDDADALREAIAGLLADPDRRAALGAAGRAAVLAEFSLEAFAARMVAALEAVIARRASRC